MKKWFFLPLVFFLSVCFTWAEGNQYGVGLSISLDRYTSKDTSGDKDQENSLRFQPLFSVMLNEEMELVPFILLNTSAEKSDGYVDYRWTYIGVGSTLYYHFINMNVISLGAGVRVQFGYGFFPENSSYDSFGRINLSMGIPLFMDLNMTDWLTFRFSWDVVSIVFYKDTYDTGPGKQSESYAYMDSPLDVENLELGFLIRF
jgi:hypothetical protein